MVHFGDTFRIPGRVRWVPVLIVLNTLSFLVTHWFHEALPAGMIPADGRLFMFGGGVIPAEYLYPEMLQQYSFGHGANTLGIADVRPPAIVTLFWSLFLHANFLHLLMNMFFLYHLGRNVEAHMGSVRFLFFYLTCGVAGMLAQVVYDLDSLAPIVGASGAISGLIGAYLILFPDHDFRLTLGSYHSRYRDFVMPFKGLLLIWILNQLLLLVPSGNEVQSIAVFAHLGGFACGLILARSKSDRTKNKRFKVVLGGQGTRGPFMGRD